MSALVGFSQPLPAQAMIGHNGGPVLEDRWYQEEAVQALFDYFETHGGTGADGKPIKANPLICLPTGTGKSLVIARFIQRALAQHPDTRIFMSTHVKTLIEQNAKKMLEVWPMAPLGVYSSGLNKRQHANQIIFGGVQSCVGKFPLFGRRDLLVVDEAHLIGSEGRYIQFINELMYGIKDTDPRSHNINPYLKVIGLSATPYRMGLGIMTNGEIFTDIAYDLCNIDGFARLMAEGYLCPLIPKRTNTELDVSKVRINADGEFSETSLQEAVDKNEVIYAALCETMQLAHDRKSWLVFASGVEHAEHIGEMLKTVFGVSTVVIHSKKTKAENDKNLLDWQLGRVRAAVSMNSLTTGVDHPACDLIVMLRPTNSAPLWVQMLGRGTRPYDSTKVSGPYAAEIIAAFPGIKLNCLVLDFARNTKRLGPINDPLIPKLKGVGPSREAPVKVCAQCGTYAHTSARECIVCGADFTFQEKLAREASELELLRNNLPQMEYFKVDRMIVVPHKSREGNESLKVAYFCGMQVFNEWINVESKVPFLKKKSRDWFRSRYHYQTEHLTWESDVPETNNEVLALARELRAPTRIKVWINKDFPSVEGAEFI